jgi:hypothetical protein
MTTLRRILVRFASRALVATLLLAAPGPITPVSAAPGSARTPRSTIAYVPGAIWGDYLEAATGGLTLQPKAIHWFDGSDAMGRVIGDVERYQADDAKAAPREALVAFVGTYAAYPATTLTPGVAVMDTVGTILADFPRGKSYAWSPDGTRLAVVFPREAPTRSRGRRANVTRYRPGVAVWDRRTGAVSSFSEWPSRAAWNGNDSLLLQFPDRVVVLDTRKAAVAATGHHGTIVSPDFRYALWPGEGGDNTRIYREETGRRITNAIFGPFVDEEKGQIRSAFWVRGRGADHLLCVCACDGIQFPEPSCRTDVIDVETRTTVASFPGEALGPSADERGTVVFLRGEGRLEFHDLRDVVREYAGSRDPSRDDRDQPPEREGENSGGFY